MSTSKSLLPNLKHFDDSVTYKTEWRVAGNCFFVLLLVVLFMYSITITSFCLLQIMHFAQVHALVQIFDDMERMSIDNPQKSVEYADYVKNHYPKGTLFSDGSREEWIVEKCRKETIDRILKYNHACSVTPCEVRKDDAKPDS